MRNCVCVNERERLLKVIQMHNFACYDVALYLDSHPTCQNALRYFEKHKQLREEATALYNRQFGPLTTAELCNPNRWTWVEGPWPWEMEA